MLVRPFFIALALTLCSHGLKYSITRSLSRPSRSVYAFSRSEVLVSSTSTPIMGFEPPVSQVLEFEKQAAAIDEVDYIVIGSGIGGLTCAALLRWYGYKVVVVESHYAPGGVAHSFERRGFKFDAGPSLWNGMSTKPYNPLREVLEIIGEGQSVRYAKYDGWVMHVPEGTFKFTVGKGKFEPILQQFGGNEALREWKQLCKDIKPLQDLAVAIPPLTLRCDPGVALTLAPHMLKLLAGAPVAGKVEGSFKNASKHIVKNKFLENWFEFLSFALSGLPANGTIAAAVAYTMRDLHQEGAALDYPVGGSDAVIAALIRGITKPVPAETNAQAETAMATGSGSGYASNENIGQLLLNSHVQQILREGGSGRAVGVRLRRSGKVIRARRAVISNASIWDTARLLAPDEGAKDTGKETPDSAAEVGAGTETGTETGRRKVLGAQLEQMLKTPMTNSFMHLYLGINATGLPADLESHYSVINSWEAIDAPQNHVIISIPSVLDPGLAPPGCHVIHAYAAANEPFDLWEQQSPAAGRGATGSERRERKEQYERLREERCQFLWEAIERSIPDVRERTIVQLPASPITHARYNRRYRGTYGPALRAGQPGEKFPYPASAADVPGLYMCGDSVFPGIGVPAVAASGANAASSTVSVWKHLQMLQKLYEITAD